MNLTADQVRRIILWLDMKGEINSPIDRTESIKENSGVDAIFMPIDDTCGIKLYRNSTGQLAASEAYEMNQELAELGLAPRVWGLSTVTLYGVEFGYFYVERVKVLYNDYIYPAIRDKEDKARMWDYDGREIEPEAHEINDKCDSLISRVSARFLKHGYELWDEHTGNFGIVRGRCVLIDMGCVGSGPEYSDYSDE